MNEQRIMYCCAFCVGNFTEMCGYFDRDDLRVVPDGRWLCVSCFEEEIFSMRKDEDDERTWGDFPQPPEYGDIESLRAEIARLKSAHVSPTEVRQMKLKPSWKRHVRTIVLWRRK